MPEIPGVPERFVHIGIGLIVAVVVLVVLRQMIVAMRRPKATGSGEQLPEIDLNALLYDRHAVARCQLELYNIPMQLSVAVVAPSGRDNNVPFDDELPTVLDQLSPGFAEAVRQHNPEIQHWPAQLSREGFVRKFFGHLQLPGEFGKGSEWTAVAGRLESSDYSLLIGLLLRAADKNSLGQIVIERETQWLDLFRIRRN